MKRVLLALVIIAVFTTTAHADSVTLEEVNASNYLQYEKAIPDRYGYNKGDELCCSDEYIAYEELFYTDGVDHWNVGLVYDESLIPGLMKAKQGPETATATPIQAAVKKATATVKAKRNKAIKHKKSKAKNRKAKRHTKKSKRH